MNEYIEKFIEYIRFQRNYSNNTEINYSIGVVWVFNWFTTSLFGLFSFN